MNRYRLAVDDGIYFLRDIAARKYRSIFDCPFLGMLRSLQTKVVINVFFETPEADFNLAALPADYRSEWADNADWLRLAFHARREFPDRPYANSTPEILARDYDDIAGEVLRFAGAATWSPTTVIHWCQLPAEVLPVLTARGVRVLSGLFGRGINYGLDAAFCERVAKTGTATDPQSGITFSRVDVIVNNTVVTDIPVKLDLAVSTSSARRVLDLLTHEQYSWPFYRRYLPDHATRLLTAVRWCSERGFEPVFLHSGSM